MQGYSSLVQRAADDGMLAVAVGQREDLPAPLLQQLLSESVDLVRRKMFQAASPARKTSIARTMVEMVGETATRPSAHSATMRRRRRRSSICTGPVVSTRRRSRSLRRERKFEETVAALAAISGLTLDAVDQVVSGGKRDSILILGRALGLEWATVRALLALRLALGRMPSATDVEEARVSFERLALPTAQRMMKFWKERGS